MRRTESFSYRILLSLEFFWKRVGYHIKKRKIALQHSRTHGLSLLGTAHFLAGCVDVRALRPGFLTDSEA